MLCNIWQGRFTHLVKETVFSLFEYQYLIFLLQNNETTYSYDEGANERGAEVR